eukprot:TRINITY_DN1270_c0_g1_i1.p1 TRINITY_DN1270_c0_g1~~TRINITY_DN1270_c0_g1_i1.p1  ORF type:complete len:674 (-),score=149.38 TRINITY_DN1270_c0_g1_i1:98-2119(-)
MDLELQAESKVLEAQTEKLEARAEKLEAQTEKLEAQTEKLEAKIEKLEAKIRMYEHRRKKKQNELDNKDKPPSKKRRAQLEAEIHDCTTKISDCTTKISDCTTKISDCTTKISDCTDDLQRARSRKTKRERQLDLISDRLNESALKRCKLMRSGLFGGSIVTTKIVSTDWGNVLTFSSSDTTFEPLQIYGRLCYSDYANGILKRLLEVNPKVLCISGTPGVGKTTMLFYLIGILTKNVLLRVGHDTLTRCDGVIRYQKLDDKEFEYLLQNNITPIDLFLLDSLKKEGTFFSNLKNIIAASKAKMAVFASSPSKRLKIWVSEFSFLRKKDVLTSIMPLWESDEFGDFCQALNLPISSEVNDLLNKYGRLPRLICDPSRKDEYGDSLCIMLQQSDTTWKTILDQFKRGKVSFNKLDGFHHCILLDPKTVEIVPGIFSECNYWATPHIVRELQNRLKDQHLDLRILFAFNGSGLVFEELAQEYLSSGKHVKIQSLERKHKFFEFDCPSSSKSFGSSDEFLRITDAALEKELCCPLVKTWPSNDGFSKFGFIQVTVSPKHPISFSDTMTEVNASMDLVENPTTPKGHARNKKIAEARAALDTALLVGFPTQIVCLQDGLESNGIGKKRFIFVVPQKLKGSFEVQEYKGSKSNQDEYGELIEQYVMYLSADQLRSDSM